MFHMKQLSLREYEITDTDSSFSVYVVGRYAEIKKIVDTLNAWHDIQQVIAHCTEGGGLASMATLRKMLVGAILKNLPDDVAEILSKAPDPNS